MSSAATPSSGFQRSHWASRRRARRWPRPCCRPSTLRRVLGNKEELRTQPNKATEQALSRNLSFFFAAFQNNGVGQAGVPAAFFLDKHTGKPRMMTGISEEPVIEAVFGKL
jgi:hypothetical protein